jgi:hypothetical protein
MTLAADVSIYQGTIDWSVMPPIALIKMSGGDAGLYMDPNAATNYTDAKTNGKAVGGYHFIGWKVGAVAEATYFLQAMSPLAENDVYALDIEAIPAGVDAVAYVQAMVDLIHSKINVYPMLYMNVSTLKAYSWTLLLAQCGLWLADWNNDPSGTIPNVPVYVMQQYNDGPNYDHDEFFGDIAQFNAYGYHAPQSSPTVATVTTTNTPSTESVTATPVATTSTSTQTSPPATVDNKTKRTNTNTPIVQDKASTLEIKRTYPFTPNRQLDRSWWSKFVNWILIFIGVRHG